jgi:prolyl-tRNA synthetase
MAFEKKELKKKSENISDWYNNVVLKAELADYGPVRGTMIIRPYGYALWEKVQEVFNGMIKKAGVENAYFPLFIPMSYLKKEKSHVEGFSPELAVVTIGGGEELAEPLVVRPTSETIMYASYAKWIKSWRDLPLLLNQWCNAVRWEKRTYLFLRTTEFLWQEGHTAHATHEDALAMVESARGWYQKLYEELFALPVITGSKSVNEKFAGAVSTYCVEPLMPDGKALQAATSHDLGQNFAKAFDIKFQNKEGKEEYVWQTSWGLSTRSLGGLFLTHGDDNGLILPPAIAPIQIVIIPIVKKDTDDTKLQAYVKRIEGSLHELGIRVNVDARDTVSFGRKINDWEVKGVPMRLEIGEKEMADQTVTTVFRDTNEKRTDRYAAFVPDAKPLLDEIQKRLFEKQKIFLEKNTHDVDSWDEFVTIMNSTRGFLRVHWCEDPNCEKEIKEKTKAVSRCLPLDAEEEKGVCVHCGKPSHHRWMFAQSY